VAESLNASKGLWLLSDAPLGPSGRDYFGFRVYAEAVASLIDNEITDTPITIALSAPWGGGKTSVALMVRRRLAERAASSGNARPALACWFDAWMHNDADHLGAALATAVARTANESRPFWRRALQPLPSAMLAPHERWRRRVAALAAAVALTAVLLMIDQVRDLIEHVPGAGTDADKAAGPLLATVLLGLFVLGHVRKIAGAAATFVTSPREEASRGSMAEVRAQLGQLIAHGRRDGRFVIYIDNLERCTPERALEACEVAGHLLSHDGVVTLLIADMEAIARAAEARYPDDSSGVGRRFLEKLVQIQVTLPAPHPEHMRRLLMGEPPNAAFADVAVAVPGAARDANDEEQPGLIEITARALAGSDSILGKAVAAVAVGAAGFMIAQKQVSAASVALIAGSIAVVGAARAYLSWRTAQAREQRDVIQHRIRELVADQPTLEELERLVIDSVEDPKYLPLAVDELQSFRLDNSVELREVREIIARYPPQLPRSAKRMLNHARLLTQIARDRNIFGGEPELTPEHLGEWIVLSERWPDLARRIAVEPELMARLEAGENETVDAADDDLVDLLSRKPQLSAVVARLAHLDPAGGEPLPPVTSPASSPDPSPSAAVHAAPAPRPEPPTTPQARPASR
jgi:hypothetical protein